MAEGDQKGKHAAAGTKQDDLGKPTEVDELDLTTDVTDADDTDTVDTPKVIEPATTLPTAFPRKRETTKRRVDLLLYIGIFLIVIAVAIAGFLVWRHYSARSTYEKIQKVAGLHFPETGEELFNPEELEIDWEALWKINPDIVGWIYLPDTRLSYPIVQGRDNDYYLSHTVDGSANSSGAIFLDYLNDPNFDDSSTFIYGHNMLGNAMFSEMTRYVDEEFLRSHPRIVIITPDQTLDLTIIGAIRCKGTDPVRRLSFGSEADFTSYLGVLGGYLVTGSYQSLMQATNVYCFSTCERFDLSARVIVIATDTSRLSYASVYVSYVLATLPRKESYVLPR